MRIRLGVPDELDDQDRKSALDAALESVTRTVSSLVRNGHAPPAAGEIKKGRVRWHPEPPGDEHFDLPSTILARGHGDCDDLAPWHAGSLRAAGIDPGARAVVKKSGPARWHAVVKRSDGSIEDPSLAAGMGHKVSGPGEVGGYGAIAPPMSADGRLCLAICPSRDPAHPHIWFARCDVPDKLEPWDWSSTAAGGHPTKAILRAVKGVRTVAGPDLDDDDDARLGAFSDLILGADPEEVAAELEAIMGADFDLDGCMDDAVHSVGFFGDLWKGIKKPFTSAVDFVKHPSFGGALNVAFSPFTGQIDALKGMYKVPGLRQGLQVAVPLAAGAFGGPAGAAAGQMASQYLSNATAPRPSGGAAPPPGMPGIPGIPPQMQALFQQFLQQQSQPRFAYERGSVARPWGATGPAVMRF